MASGTLSSTFLFDWASMTRLGRRRSLRRGCEGSARWPRLRLKDMLSLPSLVLRLIEASPPTDQTEINSAKEDFTKLELI